MRVVPLFPLKPAPAPLTIPRPIEGVVQTVPGVPEYHWWYGCGPTAAGMTIGWWDSQPGGGRLFDGDGTVWFGDLTYGTRRMVASQAHYDAGQALGLTYGSWQNHTADCIADFMRTEDGGTWDFDIAPGFTDFCAWDDPTTTNDETYTATATAYYTSSGWTYADYCAEIDAGRPVELFLTSTAGGHAVTGVGYDNTGGKQEYIAWTTWSGWPLVSWGWTGESESGLNLSVYGSTYLQVQLDVAQQPDMQVRNASEPSYIGNGVYNSDGTDQTKSQSAEAGTTVTYDLKAQNDGTTADSLVTTGTAGGAGWTVAYYDALTGGTEITGQVTGAGYTTASLAQGDYEELRVEVTPDASVSDGTVKDVLVTATSVADGTKSDTVKASTSKGAYTTIIIGTGTSSMNFPMGTWYHDERTQVVYLASEIGISGVIYSLALDVTTVPGQTMSNWTIRMKHTSMSSYPSPASWEGSGWTVCYQGDELAGSTGWRTFEFTTPFPYDGSSNLLVDFSFNNTTYTTDGMCRYSTPGGDRTIYWQTDSLYGDPLLWSGTSSPTPYVETLVPNVQLTLGPPVLTVTGITPDSGTTGATVDITDLHGTDFQTGATVKLQKTAEDDIIATDVTAVSYWQMTCTFDLTGAATGAWDVVVTNPDTSSATLTGGFTVYADPPPTVTGITPDSATNDGTVGITDLAGTGFQTGATVKLTKTGEPDIDGTSVTVVSATQITCTFDLTAKATGAWDVVVTNPDTQSGTLAESFRVFEPGDGVVNYHAVICGISDYVGTVNDLSYCDDDAYDIRDALLASDNWDSGDIALLIDSAATKGAVQSAIQSMGTAADGDDVCLFAFSGHGTTGSDVTPLDETDGYDEYLCTHAFSNICDDELGDWLAALPTDNYVVFLDTCFSGGMIKGEGAVKGIGNVTPAAGDGFAADLVRSAGTRDIDDNGCGVVVTACDDDETCQESGSLQNGVFTYYLVEGMPGPADTEGNSNDWVSGEECYAYTGPRATAYDSGQHAQVYDGHSGELDFLQLPAQQPDMQVRNASEATYIGDGVYNSDGTDQTKSQSAECGTTVTYDLKAQNDGTSADSLVITGTPGGGGWTVAYYDALLGGTEITSQVTGAGFPTASLAQGDYEELRVEVTPDVSASNGMVRDVLVTATSVGDGTKSDTVKASTTKGTTITIGTGESSIYFPMGTLFHDQRTQVIYLASEIGTSGVIYSLALDVTTVPGQTMNNWTIRMKHTSMSSYPSPAAWEGSGWTVCYQGDEPQGTTGWRTFTFTTPFSYDGTSNLLVDFSFNNASYTTDGECRYSEPGGNRTIYYDTDSGYGDPLLWSGTSSPTPYVETLVPNVQLILGASPTVTSITPSASIPGIVDITDLAGANFQTGATVKLTKTGEADIDASSVVVVSCTKITCSLDLTAAAGGSWDVVVTNPDAQSGTLADGFCLRTVTGIAPDSGTNDGTVDIDDLAGTCFEAGMTVKLQKIGETDINGTSIVVVSATKLTCTFDLTGAQNGDWDVVVTWPDTQSVTLANGFEVIEGDTCPPQITGWAIAATHGGTVGELICPVTEGHIDSRTCCIDCLVVSFTEALDDDTVSPDAIQIVGVINGDVSWLVDSATLDGDGSTMRITTSAALPDPDWYTITVLDAVCDAAGNPLAGDRDVKIGSLHGDANGNLTVDVGDMLAVRAKIGLDVDCSTARYDVNGNGTIDVGDMLAARARVGHSLPAGP